ncbi:Hint domain-containing protein [uncultured Sulfitobacter sp.]|uniref:Hint domain-containing protein n=1 Tax=uncultured Sulfitobacter sp. TaxID=191468 RepID=UPI00263867F1|nr:Hint domain-containing protein [uncultured Sulfitobacter sp.]
MPTTFNVFFLGNTGGLRIDPIEGNNVVENAPLLQGTTFGSVGNPLLNNIAQFSPGSTGFAGGNSNAYDTNNAAVAGGETFRIDGGPDQTFDASVVYNATLTYSDGTTGSITAVVFQATNGNLYLAPEFSANADQAALEAKPIQSISLDLLTLDPFLSGGLNADRQSSDFAVCFTRGTRLLTPRGYTAIEALRPGDLLTTADNGCRPIEWVGSTKVSAEDLIASPSMRPVRIRQGHHGLVRDIMVSPQHCVAVGDNFLRAKYLTDIPGAGARVARGVSQVEYFHVLCERHEMLIAEGMHTESFYPGPQAMRALGSQAFTELGQLAPCLLSSDAGEAARAIGPTARPVLRRRDIRGVSHHNDLVALA